MPKHTKIRKFIRAELKSMLKSLGAQRPQSTTAYQGHPDVYTGTGIPRPTVKKRQSKFVSVMGFLGPGFK